VIQGFHIYIIWNMRVLFVDSILELEVSGLAHEKTKEGIF